MSATRLLYHTRRDAFRSQYDVDTANSKFGDLIKNDREGLRRDMALHCSHMHPTGAKAGGIAEAEHFVQSLLAAKCSYLHQCSGAWTDWLT